MTRSKPTASTRSGPDGPPPRRRAWILGLLAFVVYAANPRPVPSGDSIPARLLAFSLVREFDFDLNEFPWLRAGERLPYFLQQSADGRLLGRYPVATPLVAAPFAVPAVLWQHALGFDDDDVRFRLVTVLTERTAAAAITAASVAALFLAAARLTSAGLATGVALAYAFATSTWSVSSQGLWQHGLAELSLAAAALALLGPDSRRSAASCGVWIALAVAARPIMLVFALAVALFVWRERRRGLPAFVAGAAPVAGLLAWYNLLYVGSVTGGYIGGNFVPPSLGATAGLLFSPSRGLLVYTPLALLALPVAWQRPSRAPACLRALLLGVAGYLLLFTCFRYWWGGSCYGPRYLTDALPALALCAVPAVERLWPRPAGRAWILLLALWGVAVQAIGAYGDDDSWNRAPELVDRAPARLWDWRDPQILRALRSGWHGGELAPLALQALTDPRPVPLRRLEASDLSGRIESARPFPWRVRAGRPLVEELRIANDGGAMWPAFSDWGEYDVAVLARWWRDGELDLSRGALRRLPRNLGPGESTRLALRLDPPDRVGTHELELVAVQQNPLGGGWAGNAVLRGAVIVEE